jgi:hypothetical protein
MGEFLIRSHPILPGERVTRREWGRLLRLKIDIKDQLIAEGLATVETDGTELNEMILERFRAMYGDRRGAEDGQQ